MTTVTQAADRHAIITTGWTNPSNAYAASGDNVYATAAPGKSAEVSGFFGFPALGIPAGSTITAVRFVVEWKLSAVVTGGLVAIYGYAGGTPEPSNSEVMNLTTTEQQDTYTYNAIPTLTQLNTAGSVQARLRAAKGSTNTAMTASIDFVRLEVDYTPPGGTTHALAAAIAGAGAASSPLGLIRPLAAAPAGAGGIAATFRPERYISPSGNDTTGTGTYSLPWATIAKAVTSATAGDTIIMRGGTYAASGQITKRLYFEAYPGETPVVNAAGAVAAWDVRAGGSLGSATGISFTGSTTANGNVYVDTVTGYTFTNCKSYGGSAKGYHIIRSSSILVSGGEAYGNATAGLVDLGSTGGQDNTFDGISVHDNLGDGIIIQGVRNRVTNCTITNNGDDTLLEHGIYANNTATDFYIAGNTLRGNAASSIKVGGSGEVTGNDGDGALNGFVLDYAIASSLVYIHGNIMGATSRLALVTVAATVITDTTRWQLDNNTYKTTNSFSNKGTFYDLAGWQAATGQDAHSTFISGTTHALAAAIAGAGAAAGPAALLAALAAALPGAGSATAAADRYLGLAAAIAGTGGASGAGGLLRLIAAAIAGAGAASGPAGLVRPLAAAPSGLGGLAPAASSTSALAAAASGAGGLLGAPVATAALASAIAGNGAVVPATRLQASLSSSTGGTGGLAGAAQLQAAIGAVIAGAGGATAAGARTLGLAGAASGAGGLAGDAGRVFALAAATLGTGAILGNMGGITLHQLAAAVTGAGSALGAAGLSRPIAAAIAGSGGLSPSIARLASLAGTLAGSGTLAPAARVQAGLAATLLGSGDAAATISGVALLHQLAAAIAGSGGAAGPLGRTSALAAAPFGAGGLAGTAPSRSLGLTAALAGTGAASASVNPLRPLAAALGGDGAIAALIGAQLELAAALVGEGELEAALRVLAELEPGHVAIGTHQPGVSVGASSPRRVGLGTGGARLITGVRRGRAESGVEPDR